MIFDGKEGEGLSGNKQQINLYADLLIARTSLLREDTGFFVFIFCDYILLK